MSSPFLVSVNHSPEFPYLIQPLECNKCSKNSAKWTFGSAFLTVLIGSLVFIIAFAWNAFAQQYFLDKACKEENLLMSKLNYAFVLTVAGILAVFFFLYIMPGEKC